MHGRGDLERLAEVLDSQLRRAVLGAVHQHGPCTLERVAEAVVEAERDGRDRPSTDRDEHLRVLVEIREEHLPTLLDGDLVDYDPDGELVEPTVTTDLLFACAETVSDPDVETVDS